MLHRVPPRTKHRIKITVSNLTSQSLEVTVYIGGKKTRDGFRFTVPPGTFPLFGGHSFVLGSERFLWCKVSSAEVHIIGEAELC